MNQVRLILRNLWFHRKPYLAVMAGVMISTAVVTGALIVGDSVRFSLQRLTDIRLGKIRYALQTNNRFFTQGLARELSEKTQIPVAPVLQVAGIAINSDQNLRINQVQILGIDERFKTLWDRPVQLPLTDEAVISMNVAKKLNLKLGDELLLRLQKQGEAPSDAPFVSEKVPSVSIRVKVSAISGDEQSGRFSLKNNQTAPYNIFLPLKQLASLLELNGRANLLLATDNGTSGSMVPVLDSALHFCMKPADAGLTIRKLPSGGIYQITSDRIFFHDATANAVLSAIPGCQPLLTYLVNSISYGGNSTPYSFVTAASESFLKQPISPGQIIINDWLSKDLGVQTGDSVTMRYFLMGPLRTLREDSSRFMVKSVIPLENNLADRFLMPEFPGMSDAGNCRDWETGAPINLKKIRDKDEQYWKDYRGTPKAFIAIDTGKKIWGNRFGSYTGFRFDARETEISRIEQSIMLNINPVHSGLFFRPVYEEGQLAARNSTDFGELFLSLSFFIVISALLLTAMLFRSLAQARMSEAGILSAIGFTKRNILVVLSIEALLVAIAGAIAGTFGGVLYNNCLILGLNTIWLDAVNTSLLVMKINPATLLTGATTGIVASLAVLLGVLWKNLRKPLSTMVKGSNEIQNAGFSKPVRLPSIVIAAIGIGFSVGWLFLPMISGKALNDSFSLIAGGLLLLGGLALLNLFLIRRSIHPANLIPRLSRLILKTLALHRMRTISAVALLSLGTFTIIITGANRKTFYGLETSRHSGTGGFLLWAESTLPFLNDLNSPYSADIFGLSDETVLKQVRFIQLPRLDGDDASCLNLNQVTQPGILGVPAGVFNRLNVFNFTNLDSSVDPTQPWNLLLRSLAPGVIPGFADLTVITWGLRKSVGDTLFYRDESGKILKIKLMGGLDNSVFQGNILVSDSLLRCYYPSTVGTRMMLIDGPSNQVDTISQRLESLFRDYGLMTIHASERLASFNAVENTYLSVFMLLGGLGIVIGTIGLGIVLLRNISQRRHELALYVALGFHRKFIFKMILAEHLLILSSGILLGLIASIPVILPLLISRVSSIPWIFICGILMMVAANGFLWIYFPARRILTQNPLVGLLTEKD
jgi:ABC-type antimicrobial peptide transport system permease subunit